MLANITGDWPYILIVIVLLFGGSQLPKLAKNAGEAMKEFKKAHEEVTSSVSSPVSTSPVPSPSTATVPQVTAALPAGVPAQADDRVTLTRAELDALLADREARAKAGHSADSPQN